MKQIVAFDSEHIHAGNKGLNINHQEVSARVDALMAGMSIEDLLNQMRGLQVQTIDGLYYAGGDEAAGMAAFRMVDGPRGARAGKATAFPVAIARGATFDVDLENRIGRAIGLEVLAKGGNVVLAPTINLLRHPGWGRAQETYSEDPFHMGAMGVSFVSGAQNHVLTSPKHFALNNQENTRFTMSANADERVLHEVYLPHFKRCVVEGAAASVMSAYNKVNGTYCGENTLLLTDILRNEWGFKGFVESDWFLGTRSTGPAIRAGMDIEMPAAYRYSDQNIAQALERGEIDEQNLRICARRAIYQKVAWRLNEPTAVSADVVECAAHLDLAREAAEKSMVLLKNRANLLPLTDRAGLKIALVGNLVNIANLGDRGSSFVESSAVTSPELGLRSYLKHAQVSVFADLQSLPDMSGFDVAIVVAGLTYKDEGEFIPTAQEEAEGGALARGGDRQHLDLPESQLQLIATVSRSAARTVVVLEGGSAINTGRWLDSVDSLVMAWYPGREGGHALARVLFGAVNPSGRLPVTFTIKDEHNAAWDVEAQNLDYDLLHGYRLLAQNNQKAQFPFGFGLSYSSFEYSDLSIMRVADGFNITLQVSNTGQREGATVPQLYVACSESVLVRAARDLKGFARVELVAGESASVLIHVSDADLCFRQQNRWALEACCYEFLVADHAEAEPRALSQTWRFDGSSWSTV